MKTITLLLSLLVLSSCTSTGVPQEVDMEASSSASSAENEPVYQQTSTQETNRLQALLTEDAIQFDNCGSIANYSNQEWHNSFMQKVAASEDVNNSITLQAASQGCYDEQNHIFVFFDEISHNIDIGICPESRMFRYNTITDIIEIAESKGDPSCYAIIDFQERSDSIITLRGEILSDGCPALPSMEYDFVANTLTVKDVSTPKDVGC